MRAHAWTVVVLIGGVIGLPAAAQVGPAAQIGQNFTASIFGVDSLADPPDSDGAAGPEHFVEFINGQFSVFAKANGSRVQSKTDTAFWAAAGFSVPSGWEVTDPRVVYDASAQRWFASQVDFDPSGRINTNVFLLAVSAGPDPTGAWGMVALPSDPGGTDFADFPTLGLNAEGVFLAGDMFDLNGARAGSTLVAVPKAGLLAARPSAAGATYFRSLAFASYGHVLQPAIGLDGNTTENVLATASLGVNELTGRFETSYSLAAFSVLNAAAGQAQLGVASALAVPGYTAPLNPTQPDGSNILDDGDARIGAGVREVGGVLYAVHATEINSRAAVQWFRVDAATRVLLETGTVTDPDLNLFYPSIAANSNGTVVIACNGASTSSFVSCYATVGQTINGTTTFAPLMLLKQGATSYHAAGSTQISRWGDYSATSLDPANPGVFWTIQIYPYSRTAWATQITQLTTTPPAPVLTIAREGQDVRISWPLSSYQLEATPSLTTGSLWSPVTQPAMTNGNVLSVLLPISGSQEYFRLISTGTRGEGLALLSQAE